MHTHACIISFVFYFCFLSDFRLHVKKNVNGVIRSYSNVKNLTSFSLRHEAMINISIRLPDTKSFPDQFMIWSLLGHFIIVLTNSTLFSGTHSPLLRIVISHWIRVDLRQSTDDGWIHSFIQTFIHSESYKDLPKKYHQVTFMCEKWNILFSQC